MRAAVVLLLLLSLGVPAPGDLQAQASPRDHSTFDVAAATPFTLKLANAAAPGALSWKDRVLSAVGSAALGAGIGFFLSQVDHSDWDEIPGQREASRGLWSALGGGLGFAVGVSFPLPLTRDHTPPVQPEESGRAVIHLEEIQEISADNAYQIVRLLRPEWLNKRPPRYIGQLELEGLPVYLDDFWYGNLDSMRGIHVDMIESIRFVPAATATARWGPGHPAGLIQVVTTGAP